MYGDTMSSYLLILYQIMQILYYFMNTSYTLTSYIICYCLYKFIFKQNEIHVAIMIICIYIIYTTILMELEINKKAARNVSHFLYLLEIVMVLSSI